MIDTFLAMDVWVMVAFMGAALVLYLTPGPDMMFTIASGMVGGPQAGIAAAVGICFGVLVHVALAAAGLAALIAASPVMLYVIRWAGAVYLVWLAWESWHAPPAAVERRGRAEIWRAARRGFLTNILNPKVGLFVLAFLPQFTDPAIGPVWHQILILGGLLFLGGLVTDGLYGVFAGAMADRVRRSAGFLNKLSAVIFGGLAARLALN